MQDDPLGSAESERRHLIRAFLEENVRVPFPPHVLTGATPPA
jgi:hypothetical protein